MGTVQVSWRPVLAKIQDHTNRWLGVGWWCWPPTPALILRALALSMTHDGVIDTPHGGREHGNSSDGGGEGTKHSPLFVHFSSLGWSIPELQNIWTSLLLCPWDPIIFLTWFPGLLNGVFPASVRSNKLAHFRPFAGARV